MTWFFKFILANFHWFVVLGMFAFVLLVVLEVESIYRTKKEGKKS